MFNSNFFIPKSRLAKAEELAKEGNARIKAKDYDGAIELYTKAIRINSVNPIFYANRAEAYRLSGDCSLCIQDCDKSFQIHPTVQANYTKARALFNLNNLSQALVYSANVVRMMPADVDARNMHAKFNEAKREQQSLIFNTKGDEFLREKKDFQRAIDSYTKAIFLSPAKYSFYNDRAMAYLLYGDSEFAIHDCDKSLALMPNAEAYGRKAAALCNLKRQNEAMGVIKKALVLSPRCEEYLETKRKILEHYTDDDSGRIKHVSRDKMPKIDAGKGHVYHNNKALAYLSALELDEALEECHLSMHCAENMKVYRILSLIYREQNNIAKALSTINIALKKKPNDVKARAMKKRLTADMHIKEEQELQEKQVKSYALRRMRVHHRLKAQENLVQKQLSFDNEGKSLQKQVLVGQETMSDFFSVGLEAEKSPRDVVVLDQRINDGVSTGCEGGTRMSPRHEEIAMISELIFKELSRDWKNLKFSITYTDEEELVVAFDAATLRVESGGVVGSLGLNDQGVSRYMTDLAVTGAAAQAKLRPRSDRWRVTESTAVPSQEIRTSPVQAQSSKSNLLGDADADDDVPLPAPLLPSVLPVSPIKKRRKILPPPCSLAKCDVLVFSFYVPFYCYDQHTGKYTLTARESGKSELKANLLAPLDQSDESKYSMNRNSSSSRKSCCYPNITKSTVLPPLEKLEIDISDQGPLHSPPIIVKDASTSQSFESYKPKAKEDKYNLKTVRNTTKW